MKVKRLEHVAIAVKSLEETRRLLQEILGLEMESQEDMPEHGARLAMFPIGETLLELVQSTREGTRTDRWIAEHGARSTGDVLIELAELPAARG